MGFEGKTAVVTGAAGGMGENIAVDLLASGAQVAAIDIKPVPASITADEGRSRSFVGDLADAGFVEDTIGQVFDWSGRIDYLVNVAGRLDFANDGSLLDIDLAAWEHCLDANLASMMHCSRFVSRYMREAGGGAMVHFSSTQAMRGDERPQDAYQAAKAAIVALSKSLAIQLAPHQIRSNAIVPGPTSSLMQARWIADPELQAATAAVVPLGRVGTTQDMADAALFLLSDRASYITGIELVVDGGLLARP